MQDYYETLQVHPKADAETIRAAYERLRERYSPAKLEGVAEELQVLARRQRDEIERAYTVLGDATRRVGYDAEVAARLPLPAAAPPPGPLSDVDDEHLDYRPLPPARRQERDTSFNPQPLLPQQQVRASNAARNRPAGRTPEGGRPLWLVPALIVAGATFVIVLVTLLTTMLGPQPPAAQPSGPQVLDPNAPTGVPTMGVAEISGQFEAQIVAAKQVANAAPTNPQAWIELGNLLYDSVVVLHERLDRGDAAVQAAYVARLPRWLEAVDAYSKALAIAPTNAIARADLATSLCYYGQGVQDQSYVQRGIAAAEQALKDRPEEGRALLSAGICYAVADPPQTSQALAQWQKLVVQPNAEPTLVFQARQLIQKYSR